MYKNLIIAFTLLLITGCGKAQNNKGNSSLSATEFSQKLLQTQDAQLVDVRTPAEFQNGHLPNAMNINWNADDFVDKTATLDKDKPVFVYCMSGPRSSAAAEKLSEMGFKKIYEMQGGMMKWRNANLPEIKLSTSKGMSLEEYNK